jgi:branched-chain amino acid transport system ATP-binding protein
MSAVFPALTALENVRVALQRPLGTSFHFWRAERTLEALDARAVELLTSVGLEADRDTLAVELPYGRKRALELATTLALDPELLLLDEPTQGMGHEELGRVVALIRGVSRGRTVLLVEHNLSVVQDLATRVTVLARGAVLAEGSYAEVSRDPAVLEAYIGAAP